MGFLLDIDPVGRHALDHLGADGLPAAEYSRSFCSVECIRETFKGHS